MTKQVSHPAQVSILRELLFNTTMRFSELQRKTDLSSDHFNFHIAQLVRSNLVKKQAEGNYILTARGKEYANTFDFRSALPVREPHVSVLLIVERGEPDAREFLIRRRLKHPHYGFYGRLSGKVKWGESFTDSAKTILKAKTGLEADFNFRMVFRKYDYVNSAAELLEDRIFIVMEASNIHGELTHKDDKGENLWMSREDFLQLDPSICYKSAREFMSAPDDESRCIEKSFMYKAEEY